MRNIKPEILLMTLGLIFSSANVFATECTPVPDCASLGYTKTAADCEGLATIKCQFDTSKVLCRDLSMICAVGSVLGNDQKCYDAANLPSFVKPIGIVFDPENRLAMALTDVKKDGSAGSEEMKWADSYCDIANSENCADYSTVLTTCGIDGRANTNAILATTCAGTTYAANAVNAYQPSNCTVDFCKKEKWFLPSIRDLNAMYQIKFLLNDVLSLLASKGGSKFKESSYWASTEDSSGGLWILHMSIGSTTMGNVGGTCYVRPVVKY